MINFSYDEKKQIAILNCGNNQSLFNDIREHFSVKNDGAKFMRKYGRFIPPRTYAITPTGRVEVGMVTEICKYLRDKNIVDNITLDESLQEQLLPSQSLWHIRPQYTDVPYPLNIPLRDYQSEIVTKCLQIGRGTVVLATAGGKTLTAASVLTNIFMFNPQKFKCLFIVPDRSLVEQTYNDFMEYGVPFTMSKWTGDDILNVNTNVIIANLGILQSKQSDISWLSSVSVLFVDEVHKIRKGNEVNKLFKHINTPCRFGLTGTMPDSLMDQWNIFGKIGPLLYERNSSHLRQLNYIANVTIQIIKLIHKNVVRIQHGVNAYREEVRTLIGSTFRNYSISKLTANLKNNSLVLVDYIEHGENLYKEIVQQCPEKQVYFIRGDVEVAEREKIRQLIEVNSNITVVAISKIFSTGINIKNLHYIIFACGGKAKIKIVQSIGRGLRLHRDKDKLIIFDIADNYKYSLAHLQKRIELYEKEQIEYGIKEIQEKRY
jgi:superfamily II DNA or RNA helicase